MKRRNGMGGRRRFRRYVTTALGIVMLVSITLTLPWRWLVPPTTAFILQDRFHHKSRIHQRWVPWVRFRSLFPSPSSRPKTRSSRTTMDSTSSRSRRRSRKIADTDAGPARSPSSLLRTYTFGPAAASFVRLSKPISPC